MKLSIISFNSHNINDGANYEAFFPENTVMLQQPSEAVELERPNDAPFYSGQTIPTGNNIYIVIKMLGNINTQIDQLKSWLNTRDKNQHVLLVKDTNNSDKQWYLMCKPIRMSDLDGQQITFTMSAPDQIWREWDTSTSSWVITSNGATHAVVVGGNVNAKPILRLTPSAPGTGGFLYRRYCTIYNNTLNALYNYPIEITGGLNTQTLISGGKMQADGDDLRVYVDGIEVNRWIYGINTTQTKVWVTLDYSPKVELTINTALGTGSETYITFQNTKNNNRYIGNLPTSGTLQIDSEKFKYVNLNTTKRQVEIDQRAADQTSTAAHSAAATARWIEHDIVLCYGNSTISAPSIDDTHKPMINLTSTNLTWDYDEFTDDAGLRAGAWRPAVVKTANAIDDAYPTEYFTASHGTMADPAVVMGMAVRSWQNGSAWKADTGDVRWTLYQPCGVWKVSAAAGNKYRYTTNWATRAHLAKSDTGQSYTSVWSAESTPGSAQSWTAWTQTNKSLSGSYKYLAYLFYGNISASSSNSMLYEVTDTTLLLTTANVPSVTLASETTNTQLLDIRLYNDDGDYIDVNHNLPMGYYLDIDCDKRTVKENGVKSVISSIRHSNRDEWFDLKPGTNTLTFSGDNPGTLRVDIFWEDRNS